MSVAATAGPEFSTNDVSAPGSQLSVQEIENFIAAIDAEAIAAIAKSIVADIMDRLWIDITVGNTPRHAVTFSPNDQGTSYAHAKYYSPDSKLMELLLPICRKRITESFSTPSEFVEKGIVFDLLNHDKTGLLDQVKDQALQGKISEGMRSSSTFYATLKVEAEKTIWFKTEHYMDGKWVATYNASIASLMADAAECVI